MPIKTKCHRSIVLEASAWLLNSQSRMWITRLARLGKSSSVATYRRCLCQEILRTLARVLPHRTAVPFQVNQPSYVWGGCCRVQLVQTVDSQGHRCTQPLHRIDARVFSLPFHHNKLRCCSYLGQMFSIPYVTVSGRAWQQHAAYLNSGRGNESHVLHSRASYALGRVQFNGVSPKRHPTMAWPPLQPRPLCRAVRETFSQKCPLKKDEKICLWNTTYVFVPRKNEKFLHSGLKPPFQKFCSLLSRSFRGLRELRMGSWLRARLLLLRFLWRFHPKQPLA